MGASCWTPLWGWRQVEGCTGLLCREGGGPAAAPPNPQGWCGQGFLCSATVGGQEPWGSEGPKTFLQSHARPTLLAQGSYGIV